MIIRILISAAIIYGSAWLFDGVEVSGFVAAIIVAAVVGLLNTFVKPLLLILTLPVTIVTFGLFTIVLNGLMFWMASSIDGFYLSSFWMAMGLGLVHAIAYGVLTGAED